MLYILRQKPDRDVYGFVDGFMLRLMDGEALDLLEKRLSIEQDFVIE
jgi:hypothetical protein